LFGLILGDVGEQRSAYFTTYVKFNCSSRVAQKTIKLYAKGTFHFLHFNKEVYQRLYHHVVNESKKVFEITPEDLYHFEETHPVPEKVL